MKKWTVLLLFLSCYFVSCVDLKKDDYLKRIAKLESLLDKMEGTLIANEIDTLTAMKLATNAVELRIKNYLILDTIDLILGKKMDAYKIMRRNLKPIGKQFVQLKKGIKEEKNTLRNLRKDIENGSGDRASYDTYIRFEKNKIGQLDVLLGEYLRLKKETIQTYRSLHAELNQYSIELLRKYNLKHP